MGETKPLTVTISGNEYVLPPVGWDAGVELTRYFTMTPEQLGKVKKSSEELYVLAVGPDVWAQMKADGADYILMWRAGLAALAHFRRRLEGATDEDARAAFDAILESGIDPEALARRVAGLRDASSTTSPATPPPARTSSTRKPASTASTRSRKQASRSSGRTSSPRKT